MRITVTGPRSVGKTTTSIMLAEELGYTYLSSDELMDEALKMFGGLSKCLQDKRKDIINPRILPRAQEALKEDNVVFDQAGGALYAEDGVGEQLQHYLSQKSVVIGLLPSMNDEVAVDVLFKRERARPHFAGMSDDYVRVKVKRNYRDCKQALLKTTKNIIYTARMTPQQVIERCMTFLE